MSTPVPASPLSPQDERTWAMASHLVQLVNYITGFGGLIAVIVIWLTQKDRSRLVEENAREALNFQITLTIAAIVGGILSLVLVGFLVLAAVVIAGVVLPILAAIKVSEGKAYRYPFTLRLIPPPLPPAMPPAA